MRKYHTLVVKEEGTWAPQFGDYNKPCVCDELDEMAYNGTPRKNMKIITTGDKQADINAGVSKLNEGSN